MGGSAAEQPTGRTISCSELAYDARYQDLLARLGLPPQYHSMTVYQGPAIGFADHADALE